MSGRSERHKVAALAHRKYWGLLNRSNVGNSTKMGASISGVNSYILKGWQILGHSRLHLLSLYHKQATMTGPGKSKRAEHKPHFKDM